MELNAVKAGSFLEELGEQVAFWVHQKNQRAEFTLDQAGQPVQIDFANALPEASNVHWHGLEVPASEDGHPRDAVMAGSQRRFCSSVP